MRFGQSLVHLGLGLVVVAMPRLSAAEPAQRASKGVREAVPLTAPPLATPPLRWRIDVARLARGVTQGTNVSFDGSLDDVVRTINEDLRTDIPISIGSSRDLSRMATAWRPPNAAALKRGAAAPELNANGWFRLDQSQCASNAPGGRPALEVCGSTDAILAYGKALDATTGALSGTDAFEVEMSVSELWHDSLAELREGMVGRVDALVRPAALASNVSLRLALFDLAYGLAARVTDAAVALEPVRLGVGVDAQGAHYHASLKPRDGSLLQRSLLSMHERLAPSVFWQLSDELESAWFGDSSLLLPLVTPGARAVALLAAARDSKTETSASQSSTPWADVLQSLASDCFVPDRALIQASGSLQASKRAQLKGDKPPAVFVPPPSERPERFWSIGLADPKGSCGSSLTAFAKRYAGLPADQGSSKAFELLEAEKSMPAGAIVARIGVGQEQHFAALTKRGGFSWLSWADTLPALSVAVQALSAPPPRRLSALPELAELTKTPMLFGGYSTDIDKVPGMGVFSADKPTRSPWALRKDGSGWTLSGSVEARATRQMATRFMMNAWSGANWSKFDDKQRAAFSRFLDSACHLGSGGACNALGVRYGDGNGLDKNLDRARALLSLGCSAGEGMACINEAFYGASTSEQLKLARRGCELKSAFSCAWYGKWLLDSHSLDDHPKAVKNLEFACDEASGFGCWQLGDAYAQGTGVARDEQKSRELYTRACNLRFATGCIALGNQLAEATGKDTNLKLALKAYEVGCKLDPKSGCYVLGYAYARGYGGEKDMKTARVHWATACDAGHAEACRALAEATEAP